MDDARSAGGVGAEEKSSLSRSNYQAALMNNSALKKNIIGEEWMALRQIAEGSKAAAIPRSVRARPEALGLIVRDDYGQPVLTEMGRRLIATPN